MESDRFFFHIYIPKNIIDILEKITSLFLTQIDSHLYAIELSYIGDDSEIDREMTQARLGFTKLIQDDVDETSFAISVEDFLNFLYTSHEIIKKANTDMGLRSIVFMRNGEDNWEEVLEMEFETVPLNTRIELSSSYKVDYTKNVWHAEASKTKIIFSQNEYVMVLLGGFESFSRTQILPEQLYQLFDN